MVPRLAPVALDVLPGRDLRDGVVDALLVEARVALLSRFVVVVLLVLFPRMEPSRTVTERLWVSNVLPMFGPLLTMRTLNVLSEWTGLNLLMSALTMTRLRQWPLDVPYRVLCEWLDGMKLSDRQMDMECAPRLGMVI